MHFGAVHDHASDKISIPRGAEFEVLNNQVDQQLSVNLLVHVGLGCTSDIKQCAAFGGNITTAAINEHKERPGDIKFPQREVILTSSNDDTPHIDTPILATSQHTEATGEPKEQVAVSL